ncbi:MAG TPA: hypothetical protein DCR46_01115 [Cytophagales bacterium]|jgi:hypothetical protein|nr:hypothetical protein [Cytophagales bacterium]
MILTHRFLILAFFAPVLLFAQSTAPKYSNEFMNIGAGAAALGMSNTAVSMVDDVTAGYWNPAGLNRLKSKYEGALMHSEYFAGIAKYDYGAIALRLDTSSVLAVSLVRFGIDNIPDTRFLYDANGTINYGNVRSFAVADYGTLISYARKNVLLRNLNLGANFKIIRRQVGQFASAWGFGLDAGAQYQYKKWRFGLVARDVTGTYNAWSFNTNELQDVFLLTGNRIPENSVEVTLPKWVLGASRYVSFYDKIGLNMGIDADFTFDGKRNTIIQSDVLSIDPKIGMEVNYVKVVYLRAGMGNVQKIKDFNQESKLTPQFNFGVGIRIKKIQIDYALANVGDVRSNGLYSNIFSLKIGIQ